MLLDISGRHQQVKVSIEYGLLVSSHIYKYFPCICLPHFLVQA